MIPPGGLAAVERPNELRERLERMTSPTLQNWQKTPEPNAERIDADACVDMGWGRIIFGHTFQSAETLYQALSREAPNQRDIAFYLRDPHVLLSMGPDQLFLDTSHTYCLWGHAYQPSTERFGAFTIRRIVNSADAQAVNRIYNSRQMVTCDPAFMLERRASRLRTYLVAEDLSDNRIIGTVTGIDHVAAFNDPENGSSLWCLAVDPHANAPGVGEALVRHLIKHYFTRGRNYIDLSVMHDNTEAIALYEKIGFKRVPVFCVKRKNQINEPLYVNGKSDSRLNPYARIIIREARRRGVGVEILDEAANLFRLRLGGRAVICRESLTELATAVAMSICDDKRLTHRLLHNAELSVPQQFEAGNAETNRQILEDLKQVVVKPARGEQGGWRQRGHPNRIGVGRRCRGRPEPLPGCPYRSLYPGRGPARYCHRFSGGGRRRSTAASNHRQWPPFGGGADRKIQSPSSRGHGR